MRKTAQLKGHRCRRHQHLDVLALSTLVLIKLIQFHVSP